jgi:hypothetical protein
MGSDLFAQTRVVNESLPRSYSWITSSLERQIIENAELKDLGLVEVVLGYTGSNLISVNIRIVRQDMVESSSIDVHMKPDQDISVLWKPIILAIARLKGILNDRMGQHLSNDIDPLYPIGDELLDSPSRQADYYEAATSHLRGATGSRERTNLILFEKYISLQNVQALIFYLEGLERLKLLEKHFNGIARMPSDSLTHLKLAYCGIIMKKSKEFICQHFKFAIEHNTLNRIGLRALQDYRACD